MGAPSRSASSAGSRMSRAAWLRVLGTIAALALLYLTFREVDGAAVARLVGGIGPAILLIPLPFFGVLLFESMGWRVALRRLGLAAPLPGLLLVRIKTEAVAQSLPGGLIVCESLTPALLQRHAGIPLHDGVAGLAVRRFLVMASQSLYLALIFALGYSTLRSHSFKLFGSGGLEWFVLLAAVLLGLLSLALFLGFSRGAIAMRILSLLLRLPSRRLRAYLEQRQRAFAATDSSLADAFDLSAWQLGLALTGGLLGWAFESFEAFLILRLLGVPIDFVSVASFEVVVVFARHVFFMLPAGLGVQDWGYFKVFAVLSVSASLPVAAAFVLLKRTKELVWIAIGYLLLLTDGRSFALLSGESASQEAPLSTPSARGALPGRKDGHTESSGVAQSAADPSLSAHELKSKQESHAPGASDDPFVELATAASKG